MKWRAALIVLALSLGFAPIPPDIIERYYSTFLFPAWQRSVTAASNLVPFALVDALLAAAAGWLVLSIGRTIARRQSLGMTRVAMRVLSRVATAAAVLYLAFLVSWGLNYRRLPLTQKVQYEPSAVSADAARVLAMTSVDKINALYAGAKTEAAAPAGIDRSLGSAFAEALLAVGVKQPARPGRPKWTILDAFFRAAGVEGMTDPFFLETLIVDDLLPVERPFVLAHEWSHLAGFTDEGEANFVGWLTCIRGRQRAQYSGWLFLYGEVVARLTPHDRAEVSAGLDAGPRADLRAVAERIQRNVTPAISRAGWQIYDRYLKANRVEAGTASYADVVRLILGIRLGPDGVPVTD